MKWRKRRHLSRHSDHAYFSRMPIRSWWCSFLFDSHFLFAVSRSSWRFPLGALSFLFSSSPRSLNFTKDRSSDVELGIKKATGNLNDWKIWGRIDLRKIQIFFFSFTFQKMELDNGSNRAKIDLYCHLHDKTLHHYQTTITVRCW